MSSDITVNLFIFAAIIFRVSPLERQFAAINLHVSLACLLAIIEACNFHGD